MAANPSARPSPADKDFNLVYPTLPCYLQTAYQCEFNDEIDAVFSKLEKLGYNLGENALDFAIQASFVGKILPIFTGDEEELYDVKEKMPYHGAVQICFNHPTDPGAYLYLFWYTPSGCFMEDTIFIAVTNANDKLSKSEQNRIEKAIFKDLKPVIDRVSPTWANKTPIVLVELSDRQPHPSDPDLHKDNSIGRAIHDDSQAKVRFSTWKYDFCYFMKLFESMMDSTLEDFMENGVKTVQDCYLGFIKSLRSNLMFLRYFRKGNETVATPAPVAEPKAVAKPPALRFKRVISSSAQNPTPQPDPQPAEPPVTAPAVASKQVPKPVPKSAPPSPTKPVVVVPPIVESPLNSPSESKESSNDSSEDKHKSSEEEEIEDGEEGEEEELSDEQSSSSSEEQEERKRILQEKRIQRRKAELLKAELFRAKMTPEIVAISKEENWKVGSGACFFCNVDIPSLGPKLKKKENIIGGTLVCPDCHSMVQGNGKVRSRNKTPCQVSGFYSVGRVEVLMDDEIFSYRRGNSNKRCEMCMRKDWVIYNPFKDGPVVKSNTRAPTVCYLCSHKRSTLQTVLEEENLRMRDIKHQDPHLVAFKSFYTKCKLNHAKKQIVDAYTTLYPKFALCESDAYNYVADMKKARKSNSKNGKRKAEKPKSSSSKRTKVDETPAPKAKSKKVAAEKPAAQEPIVIEDEQPSPPLKRKAAEPVQTVSTILKQSSAKRQKVVEEPEAEEVNPEQVEEEEDDLPLQKRTYRNGARIIFADKPSKPDVEYQYLTIGDFRELFDKIVEGVSVKPHRSAKDAISEAFGSIIESPVALANFSNQNPELTKKLGFFGLGFWIERLKRLAVSLFDSTYAIHFYITKNSDLRWISGKISTLRCESVNFGVSQLSTQQIESKLKDLKTIVHALNKDAHQMLLDHIWTLQ